MIFLNFKIEIYFFSILTLPSIEDLPKPLQHLADQT